MSNLSAGSHTITASYGGDGNFLAGSALTLSLFVNTNLNSFPKLPNGAYNLSSINLTNATLVQVNLTGANMSSANLKGANLFGAILVGANLNSTPHQSLRMWLRQARSR